MERFVPGEVKIFSRIKLPPPLPCPRDFLPSGGRFEKKQCCQRCGWEGKNFPGWREIFVSWVEKEMKIV